MVRPRITILLPVYNAAATLGEALDSVAAQTFKHWECLVVDDGSTDASRAIADDRRRRDPRFRVLGRTHSGLVATLNAGLREIQTPLVARMDADDCCLPDRLGAQLALLDRDPSLGVVSCRIEDVPGTPSGEGFALYAAWTNSLLSVDEHRLNRFVESTVVHPTVLFRRDLVDRWGGYREEPAWPEDFELWLRWMHHGVRFAKVPRVLYRWRESSHRLSRTHRRYTEDAFYDAKTHYLARGPLRGHERIGVWGAGRLTRKRAELLCRYGLAIAYYVDINPRKIGRTIHGRPVLGPGELGRAPALPILAYVASRGARDQIRDSFRAAGYVEGVQFWCAA